MSTLTWPLRVNEHGQLANTDQDTDQDKGSCVVCILSYPKGWRIDNMAFGRPDDLIFTQGGVDPAEIAKAITDFEPRATPELVASAIDEGSQIARINLGGTG